MRELASILLLGYIGLLVLGQPKDMSVKEYEAVKKKCNGNLKSVNTGFNSVLYKCVGDETHKRL